MKNESPLYRGIVVVLLCALLIIGYLHYRSLNNGQESLNIALNSVQANVQDVRMQYVKLQEYVKGQSQQDEEIKQIQNDLKEIRTLLGR